MYKLLKEVNVWRYRCRGGVNIIRGVASSGVKLPPEEEQAERQQFFSKKDPLAANIPPKKTLQPPADSAESQSEKDSRWTLKGSGWRSVALFVALPALLLGMANVWLGQRERSAHQPRPPFVPYEYLRRRTKRFPWGDGQRSLLHNPRINALPGGYEETE